MKKLLFILFLLPVFALAQTPQTSYVIPTITGMEAYYGAANRMHVTENNSDYVICSPCTTDGINIFAGAGGRKWMKVTDSSRADNKPDTNYVRKGIKNDTSAHSGHATLELDSNYVVDSLLKAAFDLKLNKSDSTLANRITVNTTNIAANSTAITGKQDALTLTTTGTSGAATLTGATLNIPQYTGGGGSGYQKNLYWVNVMDYGADSTGLTDNSVAFRNAEAALKSSGGVMYIPTGNYLFTDTFLINKPITIIGDGEVYGAYGTQASTQINCSSNINLWTINSTVNIEKVGFKWVGGSAPTSGRALYISTNLPSADTSSSFTLSEISINGFYDNLYIERGSKWIVDKSFFFNAVNYNAHIDNIFNKDQGDWVFSNSQFINNRSAYNDYGMHIIGSGGGKISNCKFNSSAISMAYCIYDSMPGSSITLIDNCSFENFLTNAIYATTIKSLNINNSEFGSYYITGPDITFVYFKSDCTFSSISNCTFITSNPTNTAIDLEGGYDKMSVNNYRGFTSLTPYVLGTSTAYNLDLDNNGTYNSKRTAIFNNSSTISAISASNSGLNSTDATSSTIYALNNGIGPAVYAKISNSSSPAILATGPASALVNITNTSSSGTSGGAGVGSYSDDGAAMALGDRLGFILFGGAKNTSHSMGNASGIESFATEAWGSSNGSDLNFEVTPNGTTTRVKALKINQNGAISFLQTNAGSTGNQTINYPTGSVQFAAGATSLVVTNSLATTSSNIFLQVQGTDVTAKTATVTESAGSFTITLNAAATATTKVSFAVLNY